MEKLSETKRRKNDGSEVEPKRRRSGSETVQYLREKSEREASIKEREFELQQRKQEEERKHHEGLLLLMHSNSIATTTASNDAFSTQPNNDNFAREICVKELTGLCWFFAVD